MSNPYWDKITEMANKQRDKGLKTYGMGLEENVQMSTLERIEYCQEETIDTLMYLEHLKEKVNFDYTKECLRTCGEINDDTLVNCALGISGESGEFTDLIKKWKFQGHELDVIHAVKELGDVLWYIAVASHCLGYTLDDVMHMNIEKLRARYPGEGFEAERSRVRVEGDL